MFDNQVQRAWEERVISPQKGNRIVHYLIRDTNANCFLAVVGIERSIRHMTYSVTEDFLRVFGSTSTVHAGTRWKSRKHVTEFLRSVVKGGGPIFDDSILKTIPHLQVPMAMMNRFSRRKSLQDEQIQGSSRQHDSDIKWSGKAWLCSKELEHYSAFVRHGTKIPVYSFVWIISEDKKDHLGYLEDMYEDQKGQKMVKVRWFVYREKIEDHIRNLYPEAREVFITPMEQEISAECIDGLAAILTPTHFEECNHFLPQILSFKTFMCQREFKNNEFKTFSLSALRGYATQPILYTLKCEVNQQRDNRGKATAQVQGTLSGGRAGLTISENQVAKGEPSRQRIIIKLPIRKPVENTLVVPTEQPQSQWLPKVNENIELLSQDGGMKGCWFRCKILRSSQSRLRVQYYDVDNVDGSGKLEEWVPASRVAAPDNVGVRCGGRLTVRPWPDWDSTGLRYEVGAAADAWWSDGWWEGLVIGRDTAIASGFQVFFPGEKKFMTVERKNMRVSKDWVDNKWISLKPKSDILAFLSESFNPIITRPPLPVLAGQSNNSVPATNSEVPTSLRLEGPQHGKGKLPSSSVSANGKAVGELNLNKQLIIRDNEEASQKSSGNAGKDDSSKGKSVLRLDYYCQPKTSKE
ncbi:hypothetical protein BUALT_Bualt03G0088800 [Buddleja alternifolia]|uniref:BAH domain-containing protein n=1 Tax=Buddleja alternifolia TaxID=168488 RepID=A0AAV6XYY2_9LAMI|nr:hypothetical protein BUALT_Bualt03G0088800 [Buddleja alternifolia]